MDLISGGISGMTIGGVHALMRRGVLVRLCWTCRGSRSILEHSASSVWAPSSRYHCDVMKVLIMPYQIIVLNMKPIYGVIK